MNSLPHFMRQELILKGTNYDNTYAYTADYDKDVGRVPVICKYAQRCIFNFNFNFLFLS